MGQPGPLYRVFNPEESAGSAGAAPAVEEGSGPSASRDGRTSSPSTMVMGEV